MRTSPERAEQDIRWLDELSELGMAIARDLQARALGAGDAGEAADMALAFQRTARSVRQTIALKARLQRDNTRHDREDREHAAREAEALVPIRKAQVRLSVERAIAAEDTDDERFFLMELDKRLDEAVLAEDFGDEPVEVHIARLCEQLGLAPLADMRDEDPAASGDGPRAGRPWRPPTRPPYEPLGWSPPPFGGREQDSDPDEALRRSSA